jgi:hypothetical protein
VEIKKGRLRQIIEEELQNFTSKLNTKKINEGKEVNDRAITLLEELSKNGDKN